MHLPRQFVRLLVFASLAVLVGCSSLGGGSGSGGNRIVTPPPASKPSGAQPTPGPQETPGATPATTTATTTSQAQLRGEGLSSTQLYTAYRAILDRYVDPVDQTQLLKAAANSLRTSLQNQTTLPMLTMPVLLVPTTTGNADKDWQAFGDAYDALVTKMPEWAHDTHPDWLVLRSMAESLRDGHTSFLTPDDRRRREETSFAGIGVAMSRPQDNQPPLITEVFGGSPAAASGLKRGDRILRVDDQDVSGQSVAAIVQLIRGPASTQVRLQVRRLSSPQPLEFTVQRALVRIDQVVGQQIPNTPIGYLKIRSFNDATVADEVLGTLDQGRKRGLRGWVVDLRSNPGGALDAVVTASAGFFDSTHPIIGYQVDRQRRQTPLETQPINLLNGMPLVVLVDHDTGSGAEILAAALQEAKVGTLVGSRTAGSVGVAMQIPMPDRSVLQVTEQRFVSPSGAALDGIGVNPDVVVDLTDEDLENDRDPQLGKALELIVEKLTTPRG